jgi:type I restriction enzyme S subunit
MQHEILIPELRFPEFKEGWCETFYHEIYSFKTTNSFSRDKLNYDNGVIKNIHYGDIHTKFKSQFDITKEDLPFVNEDIDIAKISDESFVKEGDLVIADASEDYNDIGKTIEIISLNKEKVVAGLHTFLARKESELMVLGFASFLMQTRKVRLEVMRIAQGTKVLGISYKRLGNIPLFIPRPEEQQKIASFLTAIDTRIKLLEEKKAKLEQYKKGVMLKLFNQDIRFKDDDGNAFPDWGNKKLGELVDVVKGKQLNKSELTEEGEYPCQNGGINPSGYTNTFNTAENTITISEGGNSCGYVNFMSTKFWCGGHCYSLLNLKESISNTYLYQYLKKHQNAIMRLRVGSGLPNIQKGAISSFKISTPTIEEQLKISEFLLSVDNLVDGVQNKIDKTKGFKKGLLQKMFI